MSIELSNEERERRYRIKWYKRDYDKCHRAIRIFLLVFILSILTVSLVGFFVDFLSTKFGELVIIASKVNKENAMNIGKLTFLSFIPVLPLFIPNFTELWIYSVNNAVEKKHDKKIDEIYKLKYSRKISESQFEQMRKDEYARYEVVSDRAEKFDIFKDFVIIALCIISATALVVLYYILTKDFFATLTRSTNTNKFLAFIENIRDVYIWYILPVFNLFLVAFPSFLAFKLDNRPVWVMILSTIVTLLFMVGIPILIGWLGGIVALIVEVLIVGGAIVLIVVFAAGVADGYTMVGKVKGPNGQEFTIHRF